MDKNDYLSLAQIRMERSKELLKEANLLLNSGAYKSANNRAFYAVEKSLKALLATVQKDCKSYNGALIQFNKFFVQEEGVFDREDYKKIARTETIRNASDYDDFYLASKEECVLQVLAAEEFCKKVEQYISLMKH